jgi:hypothetical protein
MHAWSSNASGMIGELQFLAKPYGVVVEEKSPGHFHIHGKLLVNYYPFGKKSTAYVAGTIGGKTHVTPLQAIQMSVQAPGVVHKSDRVKRNRNNTRRKRQRLLLRFPCCRWCHVLLTMENSSIEHIVPLMRGGLDHINNMTLACKPCNWARGSDMPELS